MQVCLISKEKLEAFQTSHGTQNLHICQPLVQRDGIKNCLLLSVPELVS